MTGAGSSSAAGGTDESGLDISGTSGGGTFEPGGPDPAAQTFSSQAAPSPEGEERPPLTAVLEAVLLVVDEPVPEVVLAQVAESPTPEVTEALHRLAAEYVDQGRGFDLRKVGEGWRLFTRADCSAYVERFVLDGQQARLTQAALETLAVVAYRQPVTRGRVSAVRGVNVDGVMRTLVARGLVEEAGVDAEGGAILYRTTAYFLERLGVGDLSDLPEAATYLPDLDSIDTPDVSTYGRE